MSDRLRLQACLAPEVDALTPTLALMPVALMVTNRSGEVLWTNTWPEDLAGHCGARMVGESAWKQEARGTREQAPGRVARVLATGKAWKGEVAWEGSGRCDLEMTITPIPDAAGTFAHALWTVNKLSRETLAVAELEKMSRIFSAAQKAARFGIFRWNVKSGKSDWSDETFRLYGLNPAKDEASFENWLQTVHPEDQAATLASIRATLNSPEGRLNIQYRAADNQRWIAGSGQVFRDSEGNPDYLDGINLDVTEQVRLETALKVSEERLALAIDAASDGVWDWNAETGEVYFSQQWKRMLGAGEDEIGNDFSEWEKRLHPEDRERVFAALQAHLEGKDEQYIAEYRMQCKDGTWKWILARGKVTNRSAEGKPLRVVGAHTDISRQKELQAELELGQTLFESMNEGVAYCEMIYEDGKPCDWIYERVNPAFEQLTGLRDVVGKLVSEIIPGIRDTNPHLIARYGNVAQTGAPVQFEEFVEALGTWFAVSAYSPRQDHFVAVIENITTRKRQELALAKSHELLSNLARLVPGVIYQYRLYPDGRSACPYSSPGMYTIFEVTPEEVREDAAPVFGRLHPEDAARVSAATFDSARTLEPFDCEFRVVLPKQGLRWRLAQAKPERTEDGGTLWHGIISDITERKQAEQEKERLTQQLMQAHKMQSVGRLAGGVAHDFNNLLTVILGYNGFLLADLAENSPLHRFAEAVQNAGERAAGLTRQLLTFSRKQVIEPKLMNVNTVIHDSAPMLERLIGEDVKLRTQLEEGLDYVMADPNQVNQVIVNLVVNARDAMPNGGKLDIATSNVELSAEGAGTVDPEAEAGRYVRITIADTGTGMDEETRKQIFEPFFTTKEPLKGTGLGLSTVFGIVRQSNGWIEVKSKPGEGTTFGIYLPRIEGCQLDEPAVPKETVEAGSETILVVEDQEDVRTFAASVLKGQGYRVLEASDGEEGLQVAQASRCPIDLLLTDVVLPGMNGKMVADKLQALHPEMPVVFCSGYTADLIQQRGVLHQGTAFLQKPFRPEELLSKVREVLAARKLLKRHLSN